ncbi:MAG: TIGR03943 family protein [Desulfobacterales bacterium]|jgi:uncharacterized repeat protein (TIGR03943 family)
MKEKAKNIVAVLTACLPALIFFIWIDSYLWLLRGNRYKAFIHPKLRPIMILALVLLLIYMVALISGFSQKKSRPNIMDAWLRAAILFLPALFLWSVYGQSLGAHALVNKTFDADEIILTPQPQPEQKSIRDSSVKSASLLDLLKNSDEFEGTQVVTEGMVFRNKKSPEKNFKIFRFAIICCAADALPLSISVNSEETQKLENETWIRVKGKFKMNRISGRQVVSIDAHTIEIISTPPPEKQYLFFF